MYLDIVKKIYPLGTKVSYHIGNPKPDLGVVIGYQYGEYGEHGDRRPLYLRVRNYEFPEYVTLVNPHTDAIKAYYTKEACDRDKKNRMFL